MDGFFGYFLKIIWFLVRLGLVLALIGVIAYCGWSWYASSRSRPGATRTTATGTAENGYGAEAASRASDTGQQAQYDACMNKAYADYQAKYKSDCSQRVIDGQCQLTAQELHDIQDYYMYDKGQCDKLKP